MKSMRPPSAAIFFVTYFHRARVGPWPPRPPPGSATVADVYSNVHCLVWFEKQYDGFNEVLKKTNLWTSWLFVQERLRDKSLHKAKTHFISFNAPDDGKFPILATATSENTWNQTDQRCPNHSTESVWRHKVRGSTPDVAQYWGYKILTWECIRQIVMFAVPFSITQQWQIQYSPKGVATRGGGITYY